MCVCSLSGEQHLVPPAAAAHVLHTNNSIEPCVVQQVLNCLHFKLTFIKDAGTE